MAVANEIRFKINPDLKTDAQYIEYAISRVGLIVLGTGTHQKQTSGYQWMLGTQNDWWMDFDGASNEFILAFRYGHGMRKEMQALRTVIIWRLGLERFNASQHNNH